MIHIVPSTYLIQDKVFPLLLFEGPVISDCDVIGGDAYVEGIPLGPALQGNKVIHTYQACGHLNTLQGCGSIEYY